MIISFTQTYGNKRRKLLEIYFNDKKLIEFKNHCDLNIYSFHNCSNETIDYFKKHNKVKNTKILIFKDISYGECIKIVKKILKEKGCTYFFFSQDDTFSYPENKSIDFDEYFKFIKQHPSEFMHCLAYGIKAPGGLKFLANKASILYEGVSFKIFESNTFNINNAAKLPSGASLQSMNDECFICSYDYVNIIFDESYCNCANIWEGEKYFVDKFSQINLNRYFGNYSFFRNYNILGGEFGPGNLGTIIESKYVSQNKLIESLKNRNLLRE